MSDVNKLDDKQCPFDPDQYKIDTLAAPVGTSPWALIQVYLGNKVHRKDWDVPDEYIHLVPGSGNDEPEIKKRDKHGEMTSWQPTQEDLMACDWELVKPEIKPKPVECMLSFDLQVGTSKVKFPYRELQSQNWGYSTVSPENDSPPYGILTNFQSTIGFGNILEFCLVESPIGHFTFMPLTSDTKIQPDLRKKDFEVTVDGSTYNLGSTPSDVVIDGSDSLGYYSDGAKQLGDLLKQNVGNTLHFCFNWK
ncbi:DUF2829 domain-containing protein [Xenorhabdus thuongxuanensis]|uniref:DUF2829 domain-containing protein n=2 Tax=Xenorhabdus thuongxuanensis TaxID=1873484 RepID=A0A1Q5U469_9GAMM|nr:DUF2829 domain-containing protein [Xenorhabdus thuongxuanensis]OKP07273.1 hypothetical protein Xentx_01550 [Xenorhabdus thuongxuanensis]